MPVTEEAANGFSSIAGFAKRHLIAIAVLGGIVIVFLFVVLKKGSGSSLLQFPDNTTGVPASPTESPLLGSSGAVGSGNGGGPTDNSGGVGVGNTVDPSSLFNSFLDGFTQGQALTGGQQQVSPTDSSGASSPVDTSASSTPFPISLVINNPAAASPVAKPGVAATKIVPKTQKIQSLVATRKPTSIQSNTPPIVNTGTTRTPSIAETHGAAQPRKSQPTGSNIQGSIAPIPVGHTMGHEAVYPKHNTKPLTPGKTTVKTTPPVSTTQQQIKPVSGVSTPRQTPIPATSTAQDTIASALQNVTSRAADILQPVLVIPSKIPAAPPSATVPPPPSVKTSPIGGTKSNPSTPKPTAAPTPKPKPKPKPEPAPKKGTRGPLAV